MTQMSDDLLRQLKEQHHNTNVLDGDLMRDAAAEITRLRERLAEADECNRRVSDENEKLRRDVKTAVMGDSAELADVKRENEKLRAALKNLLADVQDYERVNNLYPNPGKTHCWESVRAAAAAIRESGE